MAGAPTKYNEELQKKADEYLIKGFIELEHEIPSRLGLAEWLDVCDSTIDNWENDPDKPLFLGTLRRIRVKQHNMAIGKGLNGKFNSAITKLVLYNHGYSEKVESHNKNENTDRTITFAEGDFGKDAD